MYKIDKIRAHREALKQMWFSLPHEVNHKDMKVITITTNKNSYTVKIITDVVGSYSSKSSSFDTLEKANEWVKMRQDEARAGDKWNNTPIGKQMAKDLDYHNYSIMYK